MRVAAERRDEAEGILTRGRRGRRWSPVRAQLLGAPRPARGSAGRRWTPCAARRPARLPRHARVAAEPRPSASPVRPLLDGRAAPGAGSAEPCRRARVRRRARAAALGRQSRHGGGPAPVAPDDQRAAVRRGHLPLQDRRRGGKPRADAVPRQARRPAVPQGGRGGRQAAGAGADLQRVRGRGHQAQVEDRRLGAQGAAGARADRAHGGAARP